MKTFHVCTTGCVFMIFQLGCGDPSMQGRSYVVADQATRKGQVLWLNKRPITSPFPVEFDPIEDTLETKLEGESDRIWGEGGQAWKVSLIDSPTSGAARVSLERFAIGSDVRSDAILLDADPAVLAGLVRAWSPSETTPLGFGNAVQIQGQDMLLRSAWTTPPQDADIAFSLVELAKSETETQPTTSSPKLSERAQRLAHWVGLFSQGTNIARLDAGGGVQLIDQAGCILYTGTEQDLEFGANNVLLFRGLPLMPFNANLER